MKDGSRIRSEYILNGQRDKVEMLLHQTFKPEFLNRIDEIVYFNPLSKDVQYKIVEKMLGELAERLKQQYYAVTFTDALKHYIIDSSYSPAFGARPIKRFIEDKVETAIATAIIKGDINTKDKFICDVDDKQNVVIRKDLSVQA